MKDWRATAYFVLGVVVGNVHSVWWSFVVTVVGFVVIAAVDEATGRRSR